MLEFFTIKRYWTFKTYEMELNQAQFLKNLYSALVRNVKTVK